MRKGVVEKEIIKGFKLSKNPNVPEFPYTVYVVFPQT
jgi:hypothetical protein